MSVVLSLPRTYYISILALRVLYNESINYGEDGGRRRMDIIEREGKKGNAKGLYMSQDSRI